MELIVHTDNIGNHFITLNTNLVLKSITDRIMSKATSAKNINKIIIPPVQKVHELRHTVGNARMTSLDCWDLDRINCVFVNAAS